MSQCTVNECQSLHVLALDRMCARLFSDPSVCMVFGDLPGPLHLIKRDEDLRTGAHPSIPVDPDEDRRAVFTFGNRHLPALAVALPQKVEAVEAVGGLLPGLSLIHI